MIQAASIRHSDATVLITLVLLGPTLAAFGTINFVTNFTIKFLRFPGAAVAATPSNLTRK